MLRCASGDRARFVGGRPRENRWGWTPARFDGVTCSLALHYLEDWQVRLESFADALRSGGWAVVSLDHPFAPPLLSQHGGYFDRELVSDRWTKADVTVTQQFWRRPLGAGLRAFTGARFWIDLVVEARRLGGDRPVPELETVADTPGFIVYRLRRAADP